MDLDLEEKIDERVEIGERVRRRKLEQLSVNQNFYDALPTPIFWKRLIREICSVEGYTTQRIQEELNLAPDEIYNILSNRNSAPISNKTRAALIRLHKKVCVSSK